MLTFQNSLGNPTFFPKVMTGVSPNEIYKISVDLSGSVEHGQQCIRSRAGPHFQRYCGLIIIVSHKRSVTGSNLPDALSFFRATTGFVDNDGLAAALTPVVPWSISESLLIMATNISFIFFSTMGLSIFALPCS
jgi:hypothetical protein